MKKQFTEKEIKDRKKYTVYRTQCKFVNDEDNKPFALPSLFYKNIIFEAANGRAKLIYDDCSMPYCDVEEHRRVITLSYYDTRSKKRMELYNRLYGGIDKD